MLRFLLDKYKQASGPFKQARLVTGDLAEEMLDLSDYYVNRIRTRIRRGEAIPDSTDENTSVCKRDPATASTPSNAAKEVIPNNYQRQLAVSEELEKALEVPQYRKKQEFKILAILFDAHNRKLEQLSAKEVSEHGVKLGLSIRHENVRKVIRMRLDQKVNVQTVQVGSGSIYKYMISDQGIRYFDSKYLTQ